MVIGRTPRLSLQALLPLAAAGLLAAGSAQASLIGSSVTGSLSVNAGGWGVISQQFASPATVGAGTEFTGQWRFAPAGIVQQVWDITVDIGATSLTVSAYENTGGSNNLYAYSSKLFGIALGGLDLGSDIAGLSLVSGSSTWAQYDVFKATTSANGIAIDWFNLDFGTGNSLPNGGSWTWEIQRTVGQSVPEPASAGLVLVALLGAAAAGRRSLAKARAR